MKNNMGFTDKIIRIMAAILFGILYVSGTVSGVLGIILLILGVIFIATSVLNFCPLYTIFGISTCKTEK
jgi:hypothetical protein